MQKGEVDPEKIKRPLQASRPHRQQRVAARVISGITLGALPWLAIALERPKAKNPRAISLRVFLNVVGERGFEPPTHWSQTSCATKLRYSPNWAA